MDIKKKIKDLMDNVGWSEYRLAKESGLSQSTISHLFRRNNLPTGPVLISICDAFGITLAQFFATDGAPLVLTDEQHELLLLFGTLSGEQKDIIVNTIKYFID
ncbi:MAG: helix-turn-helix transcriptional regulator [Clostridiales bacterium]|nr:helix-turn-helix transcriptional regulator [Clostridiales bacterium]